MIKLIRNEFVKVGLFRLILSYIVFTLVTLLIHIFNDYNINFELIYKYVMFIGIYASMLFGGCISNEITSGSFRFYLSKPFNRWKIYLSKLLTIIIYMLSVIIYLILIYILLTNRVDTKVIFNFLLYCVPLLLHSIVILFFSTIFRSTSLCVGVYIFIVMFGLSISQIFFSYEVNFVLYTFLPYFDFCIFENMFYLDINNLYNIEISLKSGVIIILVYFFIVYALGNFIFIKKDISN